MGDMLALVLSPAKQSALVYLRFCKLNSFFPSNRHGEFSNTETSLFCGV